VDADEDGAAGGGATAGPDTPGRRSPSVGSASVPPPNRRGKNATKKEGISETLESDGHLPGFKDGVGVFPPGSDWAEVMLALKLKGKFPFSRSSPSA
jgi:bromodomain-containing protein 7/9